MGLSHDMVPPSRPYQLTQLSNEAAQGCHEGSFSNKTAASLLPQKPLLLCAKIVLPGQLQKLGIRKKQ